MIFCIFLLRRIFTDKNQEVGMKYEEINNVFLEKIAQRIPQKTETMKILADILGIGKEDVYKKIKGEDEFTFYEVMTISRQLGISLDSLNAENSLITKPFKLKLIEYVNPAETDFALMEEMTAIMKSFNDSADAEAAEITNILPQPLYVPYKYIFKFYLFKWKYQSDIKKTIPYKDIVIVDELRKTQEEYIKWAKLLHADYIFDHLLFHYLVADIRYFFQAGLITREEIQLIKQDLLEILENIDLLSSTGFIKETGRKINIYISYVNIDTNYIYVAAQDYHLTIIKAFILNGIATTDDKVFEKLKQRVQSIKQQSVLMTKSAEKERVKFLKEQRNIIESLSQF